MQSIAVPHCSACFRDLCESDVPLQAKCGHLFCAGCVLPLPFQCPLDAATTDEENLTPRADVSLSITEHLSDPDVESALSAVFRDVNTKGVLCKFVHRGAPCPDVIHCRYLHGLSPPVTTEESLECPKCLVRLSLVTDTCPFCGTCGVRRDSSTQAETLSLRRSQAESLTSSTDLMKSMQPEFPQYSGVEESKEVAAPVDHSAEEINVLQSYVDLAMSDSDDEVEEEVVIIPPATKNSFLQLLRLLWRYFQEAAGTLLSRLSKRPDTAMVFTS